MKAAILIPSFCLAGRGGAEKGAAQLANLLAANGVGADIICYARDYCGPSYPVADTVRIKPIDIHSDEAIKSLRAESYDALVGYIMRGMFLRIAAIRAILEVPFLVQEAESPHSTVVSLFSHRINGCESLDDAFWLRQALFAQASAIRFEHPSYAKTVMSDMRAFAYAFFNAPDQAVEDIQIRNDRPSRRFVCVSALRHVVKNGLAAVRAFGEFSARNPDWDLHLYGRNAFVSELERLRSDFPHASIVDHGTHRSVEDIYSDAYATIIPSFSEGLPNVLIESLSYGVPCIGFSDCPGVRDTIVHGFNGLLVDRKDPTGLAAALEEISDFDLRDHLSRNAREYAREHFSYRIWSETWLRMVNNAVEGKNNLGSMQLPAAFDVGHPAGFLWGALLDCHLARLPRRS